MARVLAPALRSALRGFRRSGWRGLALALAASTLALAGNVDWLLLVGFFGQQLLGFALIRHLAAYRDDPPTSVDEADRDLGRVLRRAATLGWGALRLAAVHLLVAFLAVLTVVLIAQSRGLATEEAVDEVELWVTMLLVLVSALFTSFVVLAEQRIALLRDQRVMLACGEALRIARAEFGPIFGITLLAGAPGVLLPLAVGTKPSIAAQLGALPLVAVCSLVATAALTHVYLSATSPAGDRLDQ